MKHLGTEIPVKNVPKPDPGFLLLERFCTAFLRDAKKPLGTVVEQAGGEVTMYKAFIHGTPDMAEADIYYIDYIIKMLLWVKGGFKMHLSGDQAVYEAIKATYRVGGTRAFDADFMSDVYEKPLEMMYYDQVPTGKSNPQAVDRHLGGCRIGFDASGSDCKVSAIIDGGPVSPEEMVWFPKITSNPNYHYEDIVSALKAAAEHMPRADMAGVSSTSVYIGSRTMNAPLFLKISKEDFGVRVKDIYIRAVHDTFGGVSYVVANDDDVFALAGVVDLGENSILGTATGTGEAVGCVDSDGCITGWFNELTFIPMNVSPDVMEDRWSGDIGCGVKYSSQDSITKLAPTAGVSPSADPSPAKKFKEIQKLIDQGGSPTEAVYRPTGMYLDHSLAPYHHSYGFKHVLLLGRVMSDRDSDIIPGICKKVLADKYLEVAGLMSPILPDEKTRRVDRSVVTVSLPELG